ncbi:hypothetical protein EDC02_7764 [Micromonospora sp. Llam0]|nr:hypothetical protein EDC02_7764 [Micromonospora sp. Llam0]
MPDDPGVATIDVLQAGVTKPGPDRLANAAWLALVHDATRKLGGVVITSVEEPTVGRNYYRVGVRLRDGVSLSILFNAAANLAAGARRHDPDRTDEVFVDVPAADVYRYAGLRVATGAELDQPLNDRRLFLLTDEERRDVAYHQPERLGDLLFNWLG